MSISEEYECMNWYVLRKLAQIWAVENADSEHFEDQIRALYELEYKYSQMMTKPFQPGGERRRENMLKKLAEEIAYYSEYVLEILRLTYRDWLAAHAITEPGSWAKARTKEYEDPEYLDMTGGTIGDFFRGIIREWVEYTLGKNALLPWNRPNFDSFFRQMLQTAMRNINQYPALKELTESFLEERKEMLREDLNEDFEYFNEMYGNESFQTPEQAEEWIDSRTIDNFAVDLTDYFEGVDQFAEYSEWHDWHSIGNEFLENQVFPVWYDKWGAEGIDDTREANEKIGVMLEQASPANISQMMAAINAGLNGVHQTGDMLTYVQGLLEDRDDPTYDLKEILTELSSGAHVEEWNKELRAVGVKI